MVKVPECFTPEDETIYPLCIGNGSEQCKECCLYVDYDLSDLDY